MQILVFLIIGFLAVYFGIPLILAGIGVIFNFIGIIFYLAFQLLVPLGILVIVVGGAILIIKKLMGK